MDFAYWRKSDFQIHTPRDPNWTGARPIGLREDLNGAPATEADVTAARRQWAEGFVEVCAARGLEAIGITDHHEMVMVPFVQQAIEDRRRRDSDFDLWLFPGMELTARHGVQCLLLFDADLPEQWRQEALSRLGIVVANISPDAAQAQKVVQLDLDYPDIGPELDKVDELKGRFIVLPNVSNGGKYTALTNAAHADFKRMSYVGGYVDRGQNVRTVNATNRRRLSGEDQAWGSRYIYPLPTSDCRAADYAHLGTNSCWIKLAEPTAEAIRQAFLGHPSRLSIDPPEMANLVVKSVRISGSAILSDREIQLSPELNAFIGGRGSGKSSYLEYIAFGLGRSCFDMPKGDYSGSERMAGLIRDTLISPGGEVSLIISQDGADFRIDRTGGNSHQPRVTFPDGSVQDLSTRELRSLFPAVVYSQGELSELGKQAGRRAQLSDLLQFVEPEFKRDDDLLAGAIDKAKLEVRGAIQKLVSAWAKQADLHKLRTTRGSVEMRIAALQKTLPPLAEEDQKRVRHYDRLTEFDGRRDQAMKQVEAVMEDLTSLWRTARQPVDLSTDLPEAAALAKVYDEFNAAFMVGVEALGKQLAEIKGRFGVDNEAYAGVLVTATRARDAAMEKLVAHRAATTQITNLQAESRALAVQLGDAMAAATSPEDCFEALKAAVAALKDAVAARADKTRDWARKIEELSGGRIQAELNVEGEWAEIVEAIDGLAAKTGSQETLRHKQMRDQIEANSAWDYLDAMRADSLAAIHWKLLGGSTSGDAPVCATLLGTVGGTERTHATCLDLMDVQRIEVIATAVPQPDITLSYRDSERTISFEKASEGQRAAALLFMLLEQSGGPLLIDQPEGDLDNRVISNLTETLHAAKRKRQLILASHNANIVVNGSSELVAHMDIAADGKRDIECGGAIDAADVRSLITATMEGGEKAFRDRQSKYGY
jgi:type III restriction enzyme